MIQDNIATLMTRWLVISNRDNSEIVIRKNPGCPKMAHQADWKDKTDDTLFICVWQQVIDKDTTLPPAITGSPKTAL
ncbi:MAG: hypothetical protein U9N40_05215 [Euryarchaeota archaeon]|nr:hypothetical protein [Euryarchaeota archaeon]